MAAFAAFNFTIYRRTGSTAWLSLSLVLTFGVSGLFSPLGGAIADRFDRRRVMIASDLSGAASFAAMALVRDPGWLVAVGFVAAVVETPFWSASAAAIPNMVASEDLAWANGLVQMGENAGTMLGPALGGALLAALGPAPVFTANAISFLVSAALVVTVRGRFSGDRADAEEHRGLGAGAAFIARDRVLRTLVLAWVVFVLGLGVAMVADVPLAEAFRTGSTGYGLMITAWGAGSVLGSLSGRWMTASNEPKALVLGTVVIGVTTAGIALSPWFPPVLVLLFASGLGDAVIMVAERGITQRRTPDAVRSRVLATSDAAVHLAVAAGFALGGPVVGALGPRGAYAVGGAAALLAAGALLPVLGSERRAGRADVPVQVELG
jgi:MFS family permease